MTTKNPRLNITLDSQYLGLVSVLADRNNQSMSVTAKELIIKALELEEDLYLSAAAAERDTAKTKWVDEKSAWK